MAFIPHTSDDVREMLDAIGVGSIEDLFDEIPAALRCKPLDGIPPAASEMQIGRLMSERAALDGRPLNFIGAGAYEHHIPAAVWAITTRGEIYTAYTPYQAEASQGTLQTIYEFQTMMATLTGMNVSNASLYDGASALAEACLMAVRANRRSKSSRILMPRAVNPTWRKCVHAIADNQGLANQLAQYQSRYGDWRELFLQLDKVDKVTKADIRRVAQLTFVEGNRTVASIEFKAPTPPPGATPPPAAPRRSRQVSAVPDAPATPWNSTRPGPGRIATRCVVWPARLSAEIPGPRS